MGSGSCHRVRKRGMAIKIKCTVCSTEHGGFHLCLGRKVNVRAEQYEALHSSSRRTGSEAKAYAAGERWARYWAQNEERDQAILKMYTNGASLVAVGAHYGLSKTAVRGIVLR